MRKILALLAVAVLIAAVPARAQDVKRVDVNFGAGYTATLSQIKDYLGGGYNINFGVTINANQMVGVQVEYSYNGLGQKQLPNLPGQTSPLFGDMNMQYGDFNVMLHPPVKGKVAPYVVAGIGVYYRPGKVTTPTLGYVPPYCDPWYFYCWPGGLVEVDQILAQKSSTDFGMDFGGGINFMFGENKSVYVEARYHYIWGPTITDPTTNTSVKANGQFLPITFGVRF